MKFKDIPNKLEEEIEYQEPYNMLTEELHSELQAIMDSDTIPTGAKLTHLTSKARQLIKTGQETGLENAKPKKGSSRAVFFPRDHKTIILDGKETKIPTAIKIAFSGQLDPFTGDSMLLGEHQNHVEKDYLVQHHYSIIKHIRHNEYETNPKGILMPIISAHPDNHYLEVGRCERMDSSSIRAYTKNEKFKRGLTHAQIYDTLNTDYVEAHGKYSVHYSVIKPTDFEAIREHPHVENMIDMMHLSGMHPADLSPSNMGIWVHPHTGVRHPVILDYGFNKEIGKLYTAARRKFNLHRIGIR